MLKAEHCERAYTSAYRESAYASWTWEDGSKWDYENAAYDELNGWKGNHESRMVIDENGKWRDWGTGSHEHGVVCKATIYASDYHEPEPCKVGSLVDALFDFADRDGNGKIGVHWALKYIAPDLKDGKISRATASLYRAIMEGTKDLVDSERIDRDDVEKFLAYTGHHFVPHKHASGSLEYLIEDIFEECDRDHNGTCGVWWAVKRMENE